VVGKYRLDVKLTAFEEIVFWIISTEGNLRDERVELENAMTRKLSAHLRLRAFHNYASACVEFF
jgi:hypothetical protein